MPEATNSVDETPLHYATKFNRKYLAFEWLRRGANVDAIDIDGRTPLQTIVSRYQRISIARTPVQARLSRNKIIPAARHILYHETLSEVCSSNGRGTCSQSCQVSEFFHPVVGMLLFAGADIRASRNSTYSPLAWAVYLLNN
jgi:hypothetical protein